jgi:hypothetical protein
MHSKHPALLCKPYLVLVDTLCSCEAYGMRPMYKKKPPSIAEQWKHQHWPEQAHAFEREQAVAYLPRSSRSWGSTDTPGSLPAGLPMYRVGTHRTAGAARRHPHQRTPRRRPLPRQQTPPPPPPGTQRTCSVEGGGMGSNISLVRQQGEEHVRGAAAAYRICARGVCSCLL